MDELRKVDDLGQFPPFSSLVFSDNIREQGTDFWSYFPKKNSVDIFFNYFSKNYLIVWGVPILEMLL